MRSPHCEFPCGLVARIRRSHRRGPGSIPGTGVFFPFPQVHLFAHLRYMLNFYVNDSQAAGLQYAVIRSSKTATCCVAPMFRIGPNPNPYSFLPLLLTRDAIPVDCPIEN